MDDKAEWPKSVFVAYDSADVFKYFVHCLDRNMAQEEVQEYFHADLVAAQAGEIAELRRQLDSMGYKEKVDRRVYMREYMRKRRAAMDDAPQLS